ncbi:Exocyst complex component SEC15B [Hibiscus syriacus]|uniref:Exocyst complex component SEC15B n=1 Tax=Hibiscus syriacus TaxID=106335 RepID=A0A6A3AKZ0_HIBSY|nr:Exocyst complex component SEC15B [Hibiscus syriacus]
MAYKCLDLIENEFQDKTLSSTLKRMLESKIPEIRSHMERKISKEFVDWLVDIRVVRRNLGQLAIGQASAARQREEDLRIKQRQAEEQSGLSLRGCVYALEEDDEEGGVGGDENDSYSNGKNDLFGFDLTPLYRAYHIHQTLGLEDRFKQYYFENRKLQLTSDFQVSSMTPFLESHQTFFAQIAGFFIIEDRILRTGGGLVSKMEVENLWETAVGKMCSLWAYGYPVDTLLNVLSKHRDKYHELLLSDCRKQIAEALADDKFEQILMKKEYEYSMNVLSFQLQTSDIVPAFPYVAPFSSTVPDCCRIVRFFIADSVSFMSYGWQLDFYDVVKKYLDRLLGEVLDEALLKLISSSVQGVSQAMQVAANMAVLERACDFFFRHAAQLSGIPLRMAERGRKQFPLNNARDAAEETLSGMLKRKVDGFMTLIENVNWTTDEASQGEKIVGALLGDSVKRFNANAKMGIDVDIRLLESFADNLSPALSEGDAIQLKSALAESRKLINLLLSNQPENFLNPVIRERSYNALDYRKVVTISEKLRDSSDRLFGTLGAGVPGRIQKRNLWMHC